jgi:5-methyltetrahydropteroyltriglutamate--homocysteine methyltransferase
MTPPFRADQIGSLLRPAHLLDLRRKHAAGLIAQDEMTRAEDSAIAQAVAMQERAGLQIISDGEFRRASYHSYFFAKLGDIKPDWLPPEEISRPGSRAAQPQARIASKVQWTAPIHVGDYRFLKSLTTRTPKITIPGPCALHFRGGDAAILESAYTSVSDFWDDTVHAFRAELMALAQAGCTLVQMDETALAKFGDPDVQKTLKARGEDWQDTLALYVEIINRVVRDLPATLRIGIHLCRGNRGGQHHAEGGYELVAQQLFNALDLDLFYLEYDSERAGGFEPLAAVPNGKSVVLGLVSTKTGALEDAAHLQQRIEAAAKFMPLDHLALSPQCGFASVDTGNPISEAQQEAKLRLVVDVAKQVWGQD